MKNFKSLALLGVIFAGTSLIQAMDADKERIASLKVQMEAAEKAEKELLARLPRADRYAKEAQLKNSRVAVALGEIGDSTDYDVTENMTAKTLKEMIEARTGTPVKKQRLFLRAGRGQPSKELPDNENIYTLVRASLGGQRVLIRVLGFELGEASYALKIGDHTYPLHASTTLNDLSKKVEETTGAKLGKSTDVIIVITRSQTGL